MIFGFLGTTEVVVILVIALLVFGPQKLPEIGKQIGSAYRELNRMRSEVTRALDLDEYGHNRYDSYHQSYQYPTYTDTPAEPALESEHGAAAATAELPAYGAPAGATHAYAGTTPAAGEYDTYGRAHDAPAPANFVAPPGPQPREPREDLKEL